MPLEDPFFVVKEEVTKALQKVRSLHQRIGELHTGLGNTGNVQAEADWTSTQLRNAIRSIEWDLEDLEDTIGIVEKNPPKFRLDQAEIVRRKNFVAATKREVKFIKEQMNYSRSDIDITASQARNPLPNTSASRPTNLHSTNRPSSLFDSEVMTVGGPKMRLDGYSRLRSSEPEDHIVEDNLVLPEVRQQQAFVNRQDNTIELISGSVRTLRGMADAIGNELDDQSVMLDDLGHDMETVDSKVNSTLKKMAHVMRLSSDKRQWVAIGALSGVLLVLLLLFFIL